MAKSIKLKNNVYIDSSGIVYGRNTLDSIFIYSTGEKIIGKWTDNKNIYRKVINTGQISSATKTVNHGISGLSNVINVYGICKSAAGNYYTLPRIEPSNQNAQIALSVSNTAITIQTGTNANFASSFVVIEYTK